MRVLFMGRKKVAADCLEWLHTQTDATIVAVLTDSHLDRSVTRDLAERLNIPVLSFDEALSALAEETLTADIAFSMLYWRKLKGAFLSKIGQGTINFHPAPLPAYKGVGGYNLGILQNEEKWAVTAHYVDEQIDTGDIIEDVSFRIDQDFETAKSLEGTSQKHLLDLFKSVASTALTSAERLDTKPNGTGRYVSRTELEEMKRIDPSTDDVERKARAFWFPPYDGAYIELQDQKFTLVPRSILETLADRDASSLFSPSSGDFSGAISGEGA